MQNPGFDAGLTEIVEDDAVGCTSSRALSLAMTAPYVGRTLFVSQCIGSGILPGQRYNFGSWVLFEAAPPFRIGVVVEWFSAPDCPGGPVSPLLESVHQAILDRDRTAKGWRHMVLGLDAPSTVRSARVSLGFLAREERMTPIGLRVDMAYLTPALGRWTSALRAGRLC